MVELFLRYEFLQNALYAGILIGFLAPLLGVFLVVRRLSLIADALSHIALAGIAASLFIGKTWPQLPVAGPYSMGMFFSVIGSLLIEKLRTAYTYYKEIAIPIILSGGIGLSVVFLSLANGFNNDLFQYLFGTVMAVSRQDVWTITVITGFVFIVIVLFFKELFFLSFDEDQAIVSGINRKLVHFIFIVMVALVIVVSMRIVGILLVSALMTLPVAAAMRFAKGFKQLFVYSIVFGELSVIVGLISAFYLDVVPGGMIVMVAVCILLLSLTVKTTIKRKKVDLYD
ncbi:metal ABC transporter permease [Halalkalibacter sp. AB-rgal2]|uniref:metal ABC transporter permease n=1 Tax=Halalkalibacter sp. AB-rgal2 TaxID=3242695 RepID=UPI00359DA299